MYKNVSFWLLITSFLPLVCMDVSVSRASLDDTTEEESPQVEIWCIDVAQGNATVIGSSDGSLIPCLVDGGCIAYHFKGKIEDTDFKKHQIAFIIEKLVTYAKTYESSQKAPRFFNVIVSHPDDDHYNMVSAIIRGCIQKENGAILKKMILGGIKNGYNATFRKYIGKLETTMLENHYPMIKWLNYNVERTAITPVEGKPESLSYSILPTLIARGKNPNAASLVVSVENNGRKFLITADATEETMKNILEKRDGILLKNVDGMYAAHHGADSDGSNSKAWFQEYIIPKIVVFSSGFHQGFRHPLAGVFKQAMESVQKTEHYHPLFVGIKSKSKMQDLTDDTFTAVGNKHYGLCVTNKALYGTMAEGTIKFVLGEGQLVCAEREHVYEFADKKSCVLEMLKRLNETSVLRLNILVTVNLSSLDINDMAVEDRERLKTLTDAFAEAGTALKHYYLQDNKIQHNVTIKALIAFLEKRGLRLLKLDMSKNSLKAQQIEQLEKKVSAVNQQKRKKQIALKLVV